MNRFKLTVLILLATAAAAVAGDSLFDALWQRPSVSGVVVVPDTYLRRWDPVTVFFPQARGKPGPEDNPERYVSVTPPHPGAYTWLDAHTLQFKPADPWPALSRFTWSAGTVKTPLATLLAPPAHTDPADGETDLAPLDRIDLAFDDPTPAPVLARMITIELRPLPGVSGAPRHLTGADFSVKKRPTERGGKHQYSIRLNRPIPRGTRATVRLGLAASDVGADDLAVSTIAFATAPPFRIVSVGCQSGALPVTSAGTRYPADQPLRCANTRWQHAKVEFSANPESLSAVLGRDLVRFDPAVRNLSFDLSGRELTIEGDFEPDTPYRMAVVPAPVFDTARRPLEIEGESAVWMSFAPRPRVLAWDAARGLAERTGPKRVPVRARGHAKADLRIYRVDPLNRAFWPFERVLKVDESLRPPGPGEMPEPWTKPTPITQPAQAEQLRALGAPGVSTLVDMPEGGERRGLDLAPHLAGLAGKNAPGHYLVGLRALDDDTRHWMRLQVTDLSLTSVEGVDSTRFFATSLATAKPVSGVEVIVEGASGTGDSRAWSPLWTGRTGSDGGVTWKAPGIRAEAPTVHRITAKKGNDVLVLDPQSPPEAFASGYWSSRGEWLGWVFDEISERGEQEKIRGHLFPERPLYRPAHAVHLKAWVRLAHQGEFEPAEGKGRIVVRGPGGAKWRLPVTLSDHGTAYAKFDEADKPTGVYTAWFELDGKNQRIAETTFKVEAYRLPTFKVGMLGPDTVPLDAPFDVAALGTYYAGGRVSARPVRWRVTQYPYRWTPKGPAGFVYSVDGRYSRNRRFEATPTLTQAGLTDLDGRAGLTLDPTIEPTAQPRTYMIEATVTGADDQTVTSTRRVRAIPAFAVGLKLPRYIEPSADGARITGSVIAVDKDGTPKVGQPLTVVLKHRQWHAHLKAADFSEGEAKYVTDTVDVEVRRLQVTSTAEPLPLDLAVPRAGVYIVEVSSRDRLGRAQVVARDLYVGGDEPVSWPKPENKTFVATPDKAEYTPGQTAKVVLQSPFQTAEALVIIEEPSRNVYRWVPVRGGKAVVSVALERAFTPKLPVHVIMLRGRNTSTRPTGMTTLDLGRPEAVAARVDLVIKPVAHEITVELKNPAKALPGKTIPLTVSLKTDTGKPMAGEVTLWLVDQAVLDLGEELPLDPIEEFVQPRGTHLAVRDTRRLVFGRIPFAVMPGGGDGENDDDPMAKATVRRDFRPVPYYEPTLKIGRDGVAQVQVKLPDNLTRFAIRAKAVSTDRFGFAKGHIDVRLPVVAQPALPRFVRAGDTFSAGIVGRVVEGGKGAGTAQISLVGGMVVGGQASTDKQGVDFGRTGTARADFNVRVEAPAGGELVVTSAIGRTSDGATDAAEVHLPIRADRAPRVTRRVMTLTGTHTLPAVTDGARPGTLQRRVTVATHPAVARAAGAVDSLRHQPDGATDGRLAQARVFLAAGALRTIMGFADDEPALKAVVRDTVAWLHQCVDGKGRIAPFPGTSGQIHLTAEAMLFLVDADEAGYSVSPQLRKRLAETLRKALRSDYAGFLDGASWTERTRALEALAAAGLLDASYLNEFVSRGRGLGASQAARVLLAARNGDKIDAVGAALGETLHDAVRLRLDAGKPVYAGLSGYSQSNPMIGAGEAAAMAVVHRGLAISPLQSDRLVPLQAALLHVGDDGGGGGPRADAEALFAVADLLDRGTDATVTVAMGGQSKTLKPGEAIAALTLSTPDAVTVTAQGGTATAVEIVRAVPTPPGSAEAAEAQGFVVARDLFRVPEDGPLQRVALGEPSLTVPVKIGEVLEEHVQITNPETRYYVAVTLPLAAGVEPLNPALKTAPPEAKVHNKLTLAPDYVRVLDDRVVWYFVRLPKGTYDLYMRTQATVSGSFSQPAARAEGLLTPSVRGNSNGARIEVSRRE